MKTREVLAVLLYSIAVKDRKHPLEWEVVSPQVRKFYRDRARIILELARQENG